MSSKRPSKISPLAQALVATGVALLALASQAQADTNPQQATNPQNATNARTANQSNASGGVAMQSFGAVSPEELKNPEISAPKEVFSTCVIHPDKAEEYTAKENGILIGDKCLSQSDAFKSAAEASSYLMHYQRTYSNFAEGMRTVNSSAEKKKEYNDAIQRCLTPGQACKGADKTRLLEALVQYNFGKDIRAQMLESESRALRMKSVEPTAWEAEEFGKGPAKIFYGNDEIYKSQAVKKSEGIKERKPFLVRAPGSSSIKKSTFRLDPRQVGAMDFSKLSNQERGKLGSEFNQYFNQFVDNYTSSAGDRKSRWHYVPAISSAVGSERFYIPAIDPRNDDQLQGKALIDKGRQRRDVGFEEAKQIQEIIGAFKENYKDVVKTPVQTADGPDGKKIQRDSMEAAFGNMGFGLPQSELHPKGAPDREPKEVAAAVVVAVNRDIYRAEKERQELDAKEEGQRFPSGTGGKPAALDRPVSARVDVFEFDKFLDAIWPANAGNKP
ncbi:MAG TPA: hypothetical protein VIH99_03205 [Bdellovibrionota bacterium]|jgi:hypothetical protein